MYEVSIVTNTFNRIVRVADTEETALLERCSWAGQPDTERVEVTSPEGRRLVTLTYDSTRMADVVDAAFAPLWLSIAKQERTGETELAHARRLQVVSAVLRESTVAWEVNALGVRGQFEELVSNPTTTARASLSAALRRVAADRTRRASECVLASKIEAAIPYLQQLASTVPLDQLETSPLPMTARNGVFVMSVICASEHRDFPFHARRMATAFRRLT